MQLIEWGALLLSIVLLSTYFTVSTQRARRFIFVIVFTVGVIAGTYGLLTQIREISYFKSLGIPLSLTVVISICFCVLRLEYTFAKTTLETWCYPILAWLFLLWAALGVTLWVGLSLPFEMTKPLLVPIWTGAYELLLIAAFGAALLSKFSLRLFQIFLPLLFILLLFALVEYYQITILRLVFSSFTGPILGNVQGAMQESFFTGGVWELFQLLGYLYLNTKARSDKLRRNIFVDKLPVTAVVLTLSSFFWAFPEFKQLRDLLPINLSIVDHLLIGVDLAMVPLYLFFSEWPYEGKTLSLRLAGAVITIATILVTLFYNPMETKADTEVLEAGEKAVVRMSPQLLASWETRSGGLGDLKAHSKLTGWLYSFYVFPWGVVKLGVVYSNVLFEKTGGALYIALVKTEGKWTARRFDLYVER